MNVVPPAKALDANDIAVDFGLTIEYSSDLLTVIHSLDWYEMQVAAVSREQFNYLLAAHIEVVADVGPDRPLVVRLAEDQLYFGPTAG